MIFEDFWDMGPTKQMLFLSNHFLWNDPKAVKNNICLVGHMSEKSSKFIKIFKKQMLFLTALGSFHKKNG